MLYIKTIFTQYFSLIFITSISFCSIAQLTPNGNSGSSTTVYTNGASNNPIYIWCADGLLNNTASLTANAPTGSGPFTYSWFFHDQSNFSWSPYFTQTGTSSTISNLPSDGYRVQIYNAGGNLVACYIAWVWNMNSDVTANNTPTACNASNLSGAVSVNGAFSYYNPPPPESLINASTQITVCFSANHTYVSDLGFYLVGPAACGSPTIAVMPHPELINASNNCCCNSGDNLTNLCFTTNPLGNINPCSAVVPLNGTYSGYSSSFGNNVTINWSSLFGCNAAEGGWRVQIYDCIAADVGALTNASITFSNLTSICGSPTSITYSSGAINSIINDNSCTAASASIFQVPITPNLTTPITINAATTYLWTANQTVVIPNASSSLNTSVATIPNGTTNFTLTATISYGSTVCTNSSETVVTVNPNISPTFTEVGPFCSGAIISPLSTNSSNGISGTWAPAINNTSTTTYTFTPSAGECASTSTMSIEITPNIPPSFPQVGPYCLGATIPPLTTISTNGFSGTWLPEINNTATTTYTFTPDAGFCATTQTMSIAITLSILPTIDLGSDVTVCGISTTLTAPTGFDSYLWSNGGTTNTTTVTANGTYSCAVSEGGCSASDTIDVTLIDVTISASDSVICAGDSVTLSVPQGGSSNTACAALPTNLQPGLVGYWPFCGNANDESGNGNNGTVNGATLTTDRFGNANSAFSLSGTSNSILVNDSPSLDFPQGVFSLCAEVKLSLLGVEQGLIDHLDLGGPSELSRYTLRVLPNNKIRFNLKDDENDWSSVDSDISLDVNVWYSIVGVFNYATQELHIYINGEIHDGTIIYNALTGPAITPPNSLFLGNFAGAYNLNGTIDNVSIYNRALSPSDIQQIYNLELTTYLWSTGATTASINVTPTQTTTYTCTTTTNGVSCPSDYTITVNNSTSSTDVQTACDSYTWIDGVIYTSSNNTATFTTTNAAGCDSLITLNLTITASSTNTTTESACDSYVWNGTSYNVSGVYTGTTANCVTESLDLTITPSSTNTTTAAACDSYVWNGTSYSTSGVYTGTTANCVTESLDLTITASSTNTTTASACDSYVWNGTSYTASGVYTGTTANCVTESLDLTITASSTNTTTASACDSYVWNGTSYTASGVYTGTTANCVTESLDLTITASSTNTTTASACDSYVWNGTSYSTSGVYTGTTANCVTESLDLTITASSTNTTTASACDSYVWNGTSYTTSGVYTGTTANCVTESLDLTITASSTNTTTAAACDSYVWNGISYSTSGVYTGTTANCVTESLDLTITASSTNTTTAAACDSYVWNGTSYSTSGVYTGTTANCVTESLDLTITASSANTTTASACDSYVWNGTSYSSSGVYTGTTANCVTESLILTINPSPLTSFAPSINLFTESPQLVAFSNTSVGAVTYSWDFGDGSYSTEENPDHIFVENTNGQTITLVTESSDGCTGEYQISIEFDEVLIYYIPNTFTPDGDVYNQTFKPVFTSGFDPYHYEMLIYNRWGEIIFETHDVTYGWDGKYALKNCQEGIYSYKITFKNPILDERKVVCGSINLLK